MTVVILFLFYLFLFSLLQLSLLQLLCLLSIDLTESASEVTEVILKQCTV